MTGSCLLVGYGIVGIKHTHCPTGQLTAILYQTKVSGEPSYDSLNQIWQTQRVPEDLYDLCITEIDNELLHADRKFCIYSNHPNEWNKTGLSYNAPQAYACTELLARGLDHVSISFNIKTSTSQLIIAYRLWTRIPAVDQRVYLIYPKAHSILLGWLLNSTTWITLDQLVRNYTKVIMYNVWQV